MKVEVLYVAECPSHPAAVNLLREVLAIEGVTAEIQEVLVEDDRMARQLGFRGSPTIRIEGCDIESESKESRNFGISCRLYPGSKQIGLPPVEMVQRAICAAKNE